MSGGNPKSLFFLGTPDLKKLVCVTLSLQEEDEELRSKQVKTCRALVLLFSDILACPSLDSFTLIKSVMSIQFFQQGFLQEFAQINNLQLGGPQSVFPGDLQCCLSFSLITRLGPRWNKAGLYLIAGKDFLTERGRLNAVSLELSTSEGRLCLSIEANSVILPPVTLEDFGLPQLVLRRFWCDYCSVLSPSSTGEAVWCHVLPSMKKGQIISISRQLPRDGPFSNYMDLQNHWNHQYGYRLPDLVGDEMVYCSVYFRPLGQKLFTYPLSCIRLQPIQRSPQVDLQGVLGSFLSDIRGQLQSVCGFPARLTRNPSFYTVSLTPAAAVQVPNCEQINLTTFVSIRPVLTRLPAPPPPSQLLSTSSGFQSSSQTPRFQQEGAQELLQKKYGNMLRSSQTDWSSSSHSSSSCSGYQSEPLRSSSSSFLPFFQPSSSLSALPPNPPPSQIPLTPPLMVPIFRNKNPSHRINVALLRVQKQEQQSGRRKERVRVTLPTFGRETSSSAASLPPPFVPRFKCHPKSSSSNVAPQPRITHISSLSPVSKVKLRIIVPPKPRIKPKVKSIMKSSRKIDPEGNRKIDPEGNRKVDPEGNRKVDPEGNRKIDPEGNRKVDPEGNRKVDPEGNRKINPEGNRKIDPEGNRKIDPEGNRKINPEGSTERGRKQTLLMAAVTSNKDPSISTKKKVVFEVKDQKSKRSRALAAHVEV